MLSRVIRSMTVKAIERLIPITESANWSGTTGEKLSSLCFRDESFFVLLLPLEEEKQND